MVLNAPHIHLMLNHVPIMGFAFALLVAVGGWLWKSDAVVRAGLVLFLITGLATVPVFLSGEAAHEVVEEIAGVNDEAIDVHEELGERGMFAALGVAILAAFALFRYRTQALPRPLVLATLTAGLVGFALLGYAGFQGGMIHHEEIRPPGFDAPASDI
jgi:uncharacterized membrane protein